MLCLAVVGLPAAGKSEFLNIASTRGFSCLEWSDMLTEDIMTETNDRSEKYDAVARLVRSKGSSHYPRMIFDRLSASTGSVHIVVGARNPEELRCLLSYYSSFRVVWISSHYLARYQRCIKRRRADMPISLEDFIRQDMYELAHGLASIACDFQCDFIFNDTTLEKYKSSVLEYLDNYSDSGRL